MDGGKSTTDDFKADGSVSNALWIEIIRLLYGMIYCDSVMEGVDFDESGKTISELIWKVKVCLKDKRQQWCDARISCRISY